jgi:hypothetical protein
VPALKAVGVVDRFGVLAKSDHIIGLMSSITLAFMAQSDPDSADLLSRSNPHVIERIVELLDDVLNKRKGRGYSSSTFKLDTVVSAVKSLLLSGVCSQKLIQPRLVVLLRCIVESVVKGALSSTDPAKAAAPTDDEIACFDASVNALSHISGLVTSTTGNWGTTFDVHHALVEELTTVDRAIIRAIERSPRFRTLLEASYKSPRSQNLDGTSFDSLMTHLTSLDAMLQQDRVLASQGKIQPAELPAAAAGQDELVHKALMHVSAATAFLVSSPNIAAVYQPPSVTDININIDTDSGVEGEEGGYDGRVVEVDGEVPTSSASESEFTSSGLPVACALEHVDLLSEQLVQQQAVL